MTIIICYILIILPKNVPNIIKKLLDNNVFKWYSQKRIKKQYKNF